MFRDAYEKKLSSKKKPPKQKKTKKAVPIGDVSFPITVSVFICCFVSKAPLS